MRSFHEGQLVTVVGEDGERDAIVVHTPSLVKVEVVVSEDDGGPVFRTVHPKVLRDREVESEQDEALRRVMRRVPGGSRAMARGGPAAGRGQRGHGHVAGHRTTGK
jgi:hypothetical protein